MSQDLHGFVTIPFSGHIPPRGGHIPHHQCTCHEVWSKILTLFLPSGINRQPHKGRLMDILEPTSKLRLEQHTTMFNSKKEPQCEEGWGENISTPTKANTRTCLNRMATEERKTYYTQLKLLSLPSRFTSGLCTYFSSYAYKWIMKMLGI